MTYNALSDTRMEQDNYYYLVVDPQGFNAGVSVIPDLGPVSFISPSVPQILVYFMTSVTIDRWLLWELNLRRRYVPECVPAATDDFPSPAVGSSPHFAIGRVSRRKYRLHFGVGLIRTAFSIYAQVLQILSNR